jgi:cell division protein FtsL
MSARLLVVLVLVLMASSLLLVRTSYESRRVFANLDKARAEQRKLDADFKRLDAEAQAQATHLRVEKVAREKLRMRTASPGVTERVIDPGSAEAVASVGAPGAPGTQLAARTPR